MIDYLENITDWLFECFVAIYHSWGHVSLCKSWLSGELPGEYAFVVELVKAPLFRCRLGREALRKPQNLNPFFFFLFLTPTLLCVVSGRCDASRKRDNRAAGNTIRGGRQELLRLGVGSRGRFHHGVFMEGKGSVQGSRFSLLFFPCPFASGFAFVFGFGWGWGWGWVLVRCWRHDALCSVAGGEATPLAMFQWHYSIYPDIRKLW